MSTVTIHPPVSRPMIDAIPTIEPPPMKAAPAAVQPHLLQAAEHLAEAVRAQGQHRSRLAYSVPDQGVGPISNARALEVELHQLLVRLCQLGGL